FGLLNAHKLRQTANSGQPAPNLAKGKSLPAASMGMQEMNYKGPSRRLCRISATMSAAPNSNKARFSREIFRFNQQIEHFECFVF
ncbi:hypothetical protein, partial [Roseibium sp.]|uniref:hypothetical protein n=1 Tax=Roseibium sp. TaxID=1936156 RepID=UPI003D0F5FD3